jgi:hypothetical protein
MRAAFFQRFKKLLTKPCSKYGRYFAKTMITILKRSKKVNASQQYSSGTGTCRSVRFFSRARIRLFKSVGYGRDFILFFADLLYTVMPVRRRQRTSVLSTWPFPYCACAQSACLRHVPRRMFFFCKHDIQYASYHSYVPYRPTRAELK